MPCILQIPRPPHNGPVQNVIGTTVGAFTFAFYLCVCVRVCMYDFVCVYVCEFFFKMYDRSMTRTANMCDLFTLEVTGGGAVVGAAGTLLLKAHLEGLDAWVCVCVCV